MIRFKMTAALLSALTVATLHAGERSKESRLTISEPMMVQNTVLAPGQYVFTLLEPDRNRTLVNIRKANGKQVGIVIGSPAYRARIESGTVFTVSQIHDQRGKMTWFHAGDNFGVEFAVR
jgi:hypothetical protein